MNVTLWFADFRRLEDVLGLPADFVPGLLLEDDWSFVIKSHAVLEASLTQLLTHHSDPRLAEVFRRLQLGGGKTGKMAFLRSLDLLDASTLKFISRFAELRNRLVHDARSFSFSLHAYVDGMSPNERRHLARELNSALGEGHDPDIIPQQERFLSEEPKNAIGAAVLGVLARSLFAIDPVERDRAAQEARRSAPVIVIGILVALAAGKARRQASPSDESPSA